MDPVTAITAAQTAISVVRLLQGGNDSGSLAQLQVEMLKAISAQLSNIASGIKTIIEKIDQLEALVLDAPKETVLQLYKAKILGTQKRYVQLMQTYQRDVATVGIQSAQSANAPLIEAGVISNLNEAITDLTAYTTAIAITPIVASAAFIHVHSAIMSNKRSALIIPQLETYVDWLAQAMSAQNPASIVVQGQSASDKLHRALTEARSLPTIYDCNDNFDSWIEQPFIHVSWTPRLFRQDLALDPFSGELGKALADYNLAAGSALELSTCNLNHFAMTSGDRKGGSFGLGPTSYPTELKNSVCDPSMIAKFDENKARAIAGNVTRLSVECLLLASWELSARAALAFLREKIEQFRLIPDALGQD